MTRFYAHFGHTDFVLSLGSGAHHVAGFFRNHDETRSDDFSLRKGGSDMEVLSSDIRAWTITFVHPGLDTPIGERLRQVREYVSDEDVFAASYADGPTGATVDLVEQAFHRSVAAGSLLAVPRQAAFHLVGPTPTPTSRRSSTS